MDIMEMDLRTDVAARTVASNATIAGPSVTGPGSRMSLGTSHEAKKAGHRLRDMADKANHVAKELATNAVQATEELERKAVKSAQEVATFCGLIQLLLVVAVDRAPRLYRWRGEEPYSRTATPHDDGG